MEEKIIKSIYYIYIYPFHIRNIERSNLYRWYKLNWKKKLFNILLTSNKYKVNYKINLQSSREKLLFTRLTIKRKNVFNRLSIRHLKRSSTFSFFYRFFLMIWQTHRIQNPWKFQETSEQSEYSQKCLFANSSKEFPPDPWNHITNGFHGKHVSTADTKNRDKRDDFDWTHFCTETNSFVLNI